MVRAGTDLRALLRPPNGETDEIELQIIALDERSGDNTLSVLSVLQAQIPRLRTVQDVEPGWALRRASKIAEGDLWLTFDRPVLPSAAAWAVSEVLRGARAAQIPGELLALEGDLGARIFGECRGGLVGAQRLLLRHLTKRGETAIERPGTTSRSRRAHLIWRQGLVRLGLGRYDRSS